MTFTKNDISKVRSIVRDETADIRTAIADSRETIEDIKENMHFIQENMLTKDDAYIISQHTAAIVMERMEDKFGLFFDKLQFSNLNIKNNSHRIKKNTEKIELNSMKILSNTGKIITLEKTK